MNNNEKTVNLYKVCWKFVSSETINCGKPMTKVSAEAWLKEVKGKYFGIIHWIERIVL